MPRPCICWSVSFKFLPRLKQILTTPDDCSGSITVNSQADVTLLVKACKTYSGTISVAGGFSGDLNLNGFDHIENLDVVGAACLTEINALSLQSAGYIYVHDASSLSSIVVPNLIADNIVLSTLPALSHFRCATGVKPASIMISDTSVSSLDGLHTLDGYMDQINVDSNPYLEDITLYLTSVGYISITGNADRAHVSFPTLKEAQYLEIGNALTISLPSLTAVTSSWLIYGGYLKTLNLPSLLETGNLIVRDLDHLSNISLPNLSHIYGRVYMVRIGLSYLSFDSVQSIAGSVWIEGDFNSVSLPKIGYLGSSFHVEGSTNLKCHALATQIAHAIDTRRSFFCMAGNHVYDPYGERTSLVLRISARAHEYDPYDDPTSRVLRISSGE